MRLGEGAQPQHARILHVYGRDRLIRREVGVRFVQQQQARLRQAIEEGCQRGGAVIRAGRVVWIGEVDQRGSYAMGGGREAIKIVAVVAVRYALQRPAEPHDVVVEGGVCAQGCHGGLSRFQKRTYRQAQQVVDAAGYHDVLGRNAVVAGERRAQLEILGIGIMGNLVGGGAHRLDGTG